MQESMKVKRNELPIKLKIIDLDEPDYDGSTFILSNDKKPIREEIRPLKQEKTNSIQLF